MFFATLFRENGFVTPVFWATSLWPVRLYALHNLNFIYDTFHVSVGLAPKLLIYLIEFLYAKISSPSYFLLRPSKRKPPVRWFSVARELLGEL